MTGRLPPTPATRGCPEHRRIDGLYDIWLRTGPDGMPVAVRGSGTPLDAAHLADLVRRGGGAGDDVRIMMDGAEAHVEIFAELAGILGRDVLISPIGSVLRYDGDREPEPSLVDARTGRPAEWLVVQPPAMATDLPGWYETTGGVLRPRSGVVAAPLPGGLTLATRADFVARRAAAVDLAPGHPELTTIGVSVRGGGFVVGDYTGSYQVTGGRQLAAALSDVPLYGSEIRMWLHWPSDPEERQRLHANLTAFAKNTGAIVWAPERTSALEILESCQDLSAVDRAGGPAEWRTYLPPMAGSPRFEPDQDGRLSPAGRMVVTPYPGAPLVSVAPARQRAMNSRYSSLRAQHGLFRIDLTILNDGRWAVQYADSGPHALGPRVLQRMLRTAGWQGEDLLLLASYPASAEAGVRRYGSRLVEGLRAEVWVLPPEAAFDTVDGTARAVDDRGRPVDWQRLDLDDSQRRWQSDDGVLVTAESSGRPAAADRPSGTGRPATSSTARRPVPEQLGPRRPVRGRMPEPTDTDPDAGQRSAATGATPSADRQQAGEPGLSAAPPASDARAYPGPPSAGRTPVVTSGPVSPVPVHAALPPPVPPLPVPAVAPSSPAGPAAADSFPELSSAAPPPPPPAPPPPNRTGGWAQPHRTEPRRVERQIAPPRPVVGPVVGPRAVAGSPPSIGPQPSAGPGVGHDQELPSAAGPALERGPGAVPGRPVGPAPPGGLELPVSAAPRLGTVRRPVSHASYWIAERPTVNAEPVELYVVAGCSPADATGTGVPTSNLFLVGTLRPPVPAALRADEHLLRVRVLAGGAVDMSSITVHEPPALHELLVDRDESYLLPGGLLGRTRLVAGYGVDASGQYAPQAVAESTPPLALRCTGAAHGIEGLPADLPRWPYDADALAYALVRDPGSATPNQGLVLLRNRPRARQGRMLVQLRVPWRCAVDVRATVAQIGDLPQIHSAAGSMLEAGASLLLPREANAQVEVVRLLSAGRLGWRTVGEPEMSLADFLASRADATTRPGSTAPTR
ncbi:hypothetical protein [Micromonospora craniellae]|uniref:Uncharacterized protein n=1 Tax=Micromonospora craniellae TaxID=2294034 RepID=A0A372FU52_9ACTN|nr:hypothetical protein [Micromonospora craniellae]QOC93837.1 hypothetical protein ID554_09525 [Micromonospora craniellae]RFS44332.1 hypothetical protein D0Q02_22945 [Micromonospora craniellae]